MDSDAPALPPDRGRSSGPPPTRPPVWKFLAGFAAVLGLLLLGSVIGSAHTSSRDRSGSTAAGAVTQPAAPAQPAVTVTATATVVSTVTATAQRADPLGNDLAEGGPVPLVYSGTGTGQTPAFTPAGESFEVIYTYDCALLRSPGRFVATLERNGDNVASIADSTGRSGRDLVGLDNGAYRFTIRVTTSCSWTVMAVNTTTIDAYAVHPVTR